MAIGDTEAGLMRVDNRAGGSQAMANRAFGDALTGQRQNFLRVRLKRKRYSVVMIAIKSCGQNGT